MSLSDYKVLIIFAIKEKNCVILNTVIFYKNFLRVTREHPNCHLYSKYLAESLLNEFSSLPIAIVRPTIGSLIHEF